MYRALCIYTAFAGPGENATFEASGGIWPKPGKAYFGKMTKSPGTHEIPELLTMVRGTGLEPVTPCTSNIPILNI